MTRESLEDHVIRREWNRHYWTGVRVVLNSTKIVRVHCKKLKRDFQELKELKQELDKAEEGFDDINLDILYDKENWC